MKAQNFILIYKNSIFMRLVAIKGNNFKNYVKIICENKDDLKILEQIRNVLSRTEFKPFIKSFNKNKNHGK